MKSHARRVSAFAAALIFSFALASTVVAAPRDDRDRDLPTRIVRLIQKVFGISAQDYQPLPPKP